MRVFFFMKENMEYKPELDEGRRKRLTKILEELYEEWICDFWLRKEHVTFEQFILNERRTK